MNSLDRGQLTVMRVRAILIGLGLCAAAIGLEMALRTKAEIPRGAIAAPALLPILWIVLVAPSRRFAAWGYRRSDDELQLRHGILTEVETLVPLDRVQHIDISQGPLERACGVCRLVLHTAGTANSEVVLPGLARATAESMRDDIRSRIREEGW